MIQTLARKKMIMNLKQFNIINKNQINDKFNNIQKINNKLRKRHTFIFPIQLN